LEQSPTIISISKETAMTAISEQSIRAEAERIFEAKGRPIWSHPLDYWTEASNLLARGTAREQKRETRRAMIDFGAAAPRSGGHIPQDHDAGQL